MNSFTSVVYSAIILTIFITIIEITKNKFKRKYLQEFKGEEYVDNEDHYKIKEFKPIFFSTMSFAVILTITLYIIRGLIGYDINEYLFRDVISPHNLINFAKGSLYIIILNSILYSGYIIQLLKRIEILNLENKNFILILKENLYGPVLEEFIYRGIIFNILKEARYSNLHCSLISSLMFGLCKYYIN